MITKWLEENGFTGKGEEEYPNYIAKVVPFFILSLLVEICYSIYKKKKFYRFNDTITNMSLGILQEFFNLWIKFMFIVPYTFIWLNFSIFQLPENSFLTSFLVYFYFILFNSFIYFIFYFTRLFIYLFVYFSLKIQTINNNNNNNNNNNK